MSSGQYLRSARQMANLKVDQRLIQQDCKHFAHAPRVRKMIGEAQAKFVFVMDRDHALKAAFNTVATALVTPERAFSSTRK